jgi:hypothetical protein
MTVLLAIHDSWTILDPAGMGRLLAAAKALESPCPAPTPPPPSPVDDPDDLGELLAGMDEEPTAAPSAPARSADPRPAEVRAARRPAPIPGTAPPAKPWKDRQPVTGRELYAYAQNAGLVRRLLAIGRTRGYSGRVVDWSGAEVSSAFEELAAAPANGKPH